LCLCCHMLLCPRGDSMPPGDPDLCHCRCSSHEVMAASVSAVASEVADLHKTVASAKCMVNDLMLDLSTSVAQLIQAMATNRSQEVDELLKDKQPATLDKLNVISVDRLPLKRCVDAPRRRRHAWPSQSDSRCDGHGESVPSTASRCRTKTAEASKCKSISGDDAPCTVYSAVDTASRGKTLFNRIERSFVERIDVSPFPCLEAQPFPEQGKHEMVHTMQSPQAATACIVQPEIHDIEHESSMIATSPAADIISKAAVAEFLSETCYRVNQIAKRSAGLSAAASSCDTASPRRMDPASPRRIDQASPTHRYDEMKPYQTKPCEVTPEPSGPGESDLITREEVVASGANESGDVGASGHCIMQPGDIVALGAGAPPEFRRSSAVITKLAASHCTVVVLDDSKRIGIGECWPSFKDVCLETCSYRLAQRVVVDGLSGKNTKRLNGCVGSVVEHPREGHPSFIKKPSAPESPILTVCVKFDDASTAGQASMLLEPRFVLPYKDFVDRAVVGLASESAQLDTSLVESVIARHRNAE